MVQPFRRFVLTLFVASAAALLLAAPASAHADDTYAAIAYSPKTGAFGFSFKFDSRKGAEKVALTECRADDAQVIVWVKNGWCSLAVGDDGYGGGSADDLGTARKRALAECRKHTENGKVLISVSSDGEVKED